jgi:hypothetical protein
VIEIPNNPIPDEKKEKIVVMMEHFSIRYVAREVGVSIDTVRKYRSSDNNDENQKQKA